MVDLHVDASHCLSGSTDTGPAPVVSVVMSVYNNGRQLCRSIDSILCQADVSFEFIIVNDGSTDDSSAILAEYARIDSRVRVLEQENQGLTKALIRACTAARGRYIARQDADDWSYPERLSRLASALDAQDSLVLVASWSESVGPQGELLRTHRRSESAEAAKRELLEQIIGPPGHGTAMFRRDAYMRVGGYRPAFYYGQDYDLWLRLALVGDVLYVPAVLYRFEMNDNSISGSNRHIRELYTQALRACHRARLRGDDESEWLTVAQQLPRGPHGGSKGSRARTCYFIGRCLIKQRDSRAVEYLWKAIATRPWFGRAWVYLLWYCVQSAMGLHSAPPRALAELGDHPESFM